MKCLGVGIVREAGGSCFSWCSSEVLQYQVEPNMKLCLWYFGAPCNGTVQTSIVVSAGLAPPAWVTGVIASGAAFFCLFVCLLVFLTILATVENSAK